MKEELIKQISGVMEFTKDGIVKVVDVVQAEAPELISQVLSWELTVGCVGVVVGAVLSIPVVYCVREILKECKKPYLHQDDSLIFTNSLLSIIVGIVSQVMFWNCLLKVLKIAVAPKIYLLGYLTDLLQ